jgi:AcrR family transcriptional regulator
LDKKTQTQIKILDAALNQFAEKGYDLASTNVICGNAGVSKGTVFKYFATKRSLFSAVFARELDLYISRFETVKMMEYKDPWEKMAATIIWKAEHARTYPLSTKLLAEGFSGEIKKLSPQVLEKIQNLEALSLDRLFGDFSKERLRNDLTENDVKKILKIFVSGFQTVYVSGHRDFINSKEAVEECMRFMKIIYRGMEKEHE